MAWLRPILLLAGALFIVLLVWWERRRPRQASELGASRATRSEPALESSAAAEVPAGTPPHHERPGARWNEAGEVRDRDLRRTPPIIDWSDAALAAQDPRASAVADPANDASPGPLPELVVDWPAEEARRIVTLRILPARQDRLPGRALRQGLTACGFRHGQFGIFHLPGEDGRVVISAASLVRPGILDPSTMDFQRFAGINLFAVLPGPLSSEVALQRLGQIAVEVAARVGGQVQDESSAPFSAGDAPAWRRRCLTAIESARATAGQAD
jgi:FtsZ-interacting cell division protein ZipA